MVSATKVARELREATTLSIMSLTGAGLAVAAIAGIALVFLFADSEERQDTAVWQERLGIVAETRAAAVDEWIDRQYRALASLAENASLQLYMTELSRAADQSPRVTEELAEAGYLRNLLTVVADRAGYLVNAPGPDIEANVDRVGVSGIALVDPAGNVLVGTRGMPPVDPVAFPELLFPAAGGRGFLDIRKAPGGELIMGFSVPVFAVQDDGGAARPIGRVVGIRLVETGLFPTLAQPGFAWKSAEIYLVRRSGDTVEFLSPRRGGRAPLTGGLVAEPSRLVAAAAAAAPFGIGRDYAGDTVLYAARRISAAPWSVIVKVARDEAMGESDARRQAITAAMLAVIFLVAVGFIAVWRHGTSLRASAAASRYRDLAQRYEAQSGFLRLVADSQPSPMFIVDRDGRFRFANRAAAERAETSDRDMIGKSLTSVLGPAAARQYEETNGNVIETGMMTSQVRRSGANGDLRVVQAEYIPVFDGPDFDRGVLVVEQDITGVVSEREHRVTALKQLVRTLLTLVDSRDPHAANHSTQVAVVARAIAEEMGLDDDLVDAAETAGSLMNVGKLLVPSDLLTRPGTLEDDERRRIRESIASAVDLLADVPFVGPVVDTLRQMNECWDGSGHPRGLAGTDILVTARIVAVANAFVAMLNPRAWRPGVDFDQAVERLLEASGREFDRAVVAALVNRLENRGGRREWAHLVPATAS